MESILGKLNLKECREFIRQYALMNDEFKTVLELWFAGKDDRIDIGKKYRSLVARIFHKYSSHRNFIEYHEVYGLSMEIGGLLRTAQDFARDKRFKEAFAIANAVLTATIKALSFSDDSDGYLGGLLEEAIEQIDRIVDSKNAGTALQEEIFEFLQEQLLDEEYFDYGDFGEQMFPVFRKVSQQLHRSREFLQHVDDQISKVITSVSSYRRDFFQMEKIEFLKETGQKGAAEKLIQEHMDIVEIRKGVVDKAVRQKDYGLAKDLIAEGISIAERQGHLGTVSEWIEQLLEIAVKENDRVAIRSYAKYLAFDRGFSQKHYRQWKATYKPAEWKKVIEQGIADLLKSHARPNHHILRDVIAAVYIEEKYWDRLLEIVRKADSVTGVMAYNAQLASRYPTEMLQIYLPLLEKAGRLAKTRFQYADLATKMKKILKTVPGARKAILDLAHKLKDQFPRRRAMAEEFDTVLK